MHAVLGHASQPPASKSAFAIQSLTFGGSIWGWGGGCRSGCTPLTPALSAGVTYAYAPKGGDPYGAPPANNDVTAFKPPLTLIALARLARQNSPHEAAGGR